ncbi:MAG: diadenylate cyclase CdaA [Lachnospiraceae bacterium]|nr:diadenylate cyclase CdaA [Lachnospiraceae bacterium]MBQ6354267.1 diadenylate cyclase CdaA [Lachnospiraceae bacterium]
MSAQIKDYFASWFDWIYLPQIGVLDIIEIIIIAVLVYAVLVWIKNTKAWMLLRGFVVLGVFILIAVLFRMSTILWLVRNGIGILAIAAVVVFQPELRRALERLGERNLFARLFSINRGKDELRFSNGTLRAITTAVAEMAEEKTGALIVVEKAIHLTEYELTGIPMDSLVSPQLLVNIFEHNTPLHDGAVIIRGDRIMAATCYLPLSENMSISKSLGTRHRAGLGLSEVCDAAVIIVSEETGGVSVAREGQLISDVDPGHLNEILTDLQKTEKAKAKGKSHEKQDI